MTTPQSPQGPHDPQGPRSADSPEAAPAARQPHGLIPILATPFTAAGDLDLPSLRTLVDFQLASGVDGVAVFGMASEGFALTGAERTAILRTVRATAGPDLPVVAGVNATSTVTAREQAVRAAEDGADHLMVLPPFLTKPSAGQVLDFYAEVAAAAPVPVMIQDAPGVTGVGIGVDQITALAAEPGITSVKVEVPAPPAKIAAVTAAVGRRLAVLGGQNAQYVIDEADCGAVGTMPACEFSDVLRGLLDALGAGDRTTARAAFRRLLPLIHLGIRAGQAWAVHKEVLVRRGVIACPAVRLPAAPLDAATRRALDEVLAETALPAYRPAG
ncbi:dihydrodipicolinate synthase family protein [Actinacidiphila sp. bgisy144]|uniref:dihydrodipicolinate synthase family protein n=1 Tax=Actinacidiphila sp. bgisy144 TaxID=3413791 RepID=UPI003EC146DF